MTSRGITATRSRQMLLVWGLLVVAANLRAPLTGVGPVLDQIQADRGLSPTTAGLLTTLPLLAFAALSPLVPRLTMRRSPERVLAWALVVLAVGVGLRWVPTVPGLFVGTTLIGAGAAVGNVLLPSLIKRDFPERVGFLTAAYATVMGGVAAVASGIAVPLSEVAPGGWRTGVGCWLLLVVVGIVLWLPQTRRSTRLTTEAPRRARLPWSSPLAWAVTAFMGLQSLGFYVVITWLPQILHDTGDTASADAGWLLFLFQAVAVVTSLAVPAVMRSKTDQRMLAVVSSAVLLAGYLGLVILPGWAVVWTIVLGLGGGACLVLALAFLGLRAADAAGAGALSAMAQSIGYLLAAIGPVLLGALHSVTTGWQAPLVVMCVAAAAQVVVAVVAGRGTVIDSAASVAAKQRTD